MSWGTPSSRMRKSACRSPGTRCPLLSVTTTGTTTCRTSMWRVGSCWAKAAAQPSRREKRIRTLTLGGDVRLRSSSGDQLRQQIDRHVDRQHVRDDNRRAAISVYRIELGALVGEELDNLTDLRLSRGLHGAGDSCVHHRGLRLSLGFNRIWIKLPCVLHRLDVTAVGGGHQKRAAVLRMSLSIGACGNQRLHCFKMVASGCQHERRLFAGRTAEKSASATPTGRRSLIRLRVYVRSSGDEAFHKTHLTQLR